MEAMGREVDAIAMWEADVTGEASITDDAKTGDAVGRGGNAIADDPNNGQGSERKRIAMANITLRINIRKNIRDPISSFISNKK